MIEFGQAWVFVETGVLLGLAVGAAASHSGPAPRFVAPLFLICGVALMLAAVVHG